MATETIIGSYRIEERIGRGGMGVVYRGQHTKLPREVAIKSINPRAGDHDLRHMRHRFEREAFIQSQLDHPGIVKIYDYIVAEQTYYIVMEYVEGRSLAQLLKQEEGRPLTCERALNLFDQILTAVTYAHTFTYRDQDGATHRGIIHRDLKPPNILVTPDDKIKITDFGIVKVVGSETTDTFGGGYGSPRYVSPEQAEGLEVDQRSDIYSLGIILYEMLTGAPPFGNEREPLTRTEILRAHVELPPPLPTEINPLIPLEVESIILCALEKDPFGRYATTTDFLRAIRIARERDLSDVSEEAEAPPKTYRPVGTHELHESADNTVRQDYITQPIRSGSCAVCGTEAEADEEHCLSCGAELGASPATTKLAHGKTKPPEVQQQQQQGGQLQQLQLARKSQRGKWVVIGLIALALLSGVLIYMRFTREAERRAARAAQAVAAAPQTVVPSMQASSAQSSLVELGAARVAVDSSYDGYTAKPLNDGIIDVKRISGMRYNEGNWASAETEDAHWIEFQLAQPARIAAVYIYWGFDRARFVASRRVELQTPDERGQWRTISTIEPGSDYDRTAFEFAPVKTERVRILQPAQQGPRGRPFVMWVREVKVFALAGD